nr:Sir2 family NAD-dependent protein deacetylase [Pseudactinotalea sp. HY158]
MTSSTAVIDLLRGTPFTVLTGAGLSTDSGIPDYRGPSARPRTPMTYQQFVSDEAFRRHYWARNHVGYRHMRSVEPNEGHRVLARLEARGLATGVITQNVDLLHERAGSNRVIDLHGRSDTVICLDCGTRISRAHMQVRLDLANPGFDVAVSDVEIAPDADAVLTQTEDFVVPPCAVCGGMLKPDVVYFGENVPKQRVADAYALVDRGGAFLALGTSLAVMSGLRFVRHAVRHGIAVAIVNRGETRGDELATVKLEAGTTPTLLELEAALAG